MLHKMYQSFRLTVCPHPGCVLLLPGQSSGPAGGPTDPLVAMETWPVARLKFYTVEPAWNLTNMETAITHDGGRFALKPSMTAASHWHQESKLSAISHPLWEPRPGPAQKTIVWALWLRATQCQHHWGNWMVAGTAKYSISMPSWCLLCAYTLLRCHGRQFHLALTAETSNMLKTRSSM